LIGHEIVIGASHCSDRAPISPPEKSSEARAFAKLALLSLVAHLSLVLAFVLLDPMPSAVDGSRAIPVEVVSARPQTPANLAGAQRDAGDKGPPVKESAEVPNKDGRQAASTADERQPVRSAPGPSFDASPYKLRAFAAPATAATGEAINYQLVVGGMLERAKHYPESAIRRGAQGTATIGFVVDESGAVATVSLLRSSGEADLDTESVDLVRRAAPFPPPPPKAKRSFAIEVAFEIKK
jgi:colicin import membrane protein